MISPSDLLLSPRNPITSPAPTWAFAGSVERGAVGFVRADIAGGHVHAPVLAVRGVPLGTQHVPLPVHPAAPNAPIAPVDCSLLPLGYGHFVSFLRRFQQVVYWGHPNRHNQARQHHHHDYEDALHERDLLPERVGLVI